MTLSNMNAIEKTAVDGVRALEWREDRLILLDQRRLPGEECYLEARTSSDVAAAISDMVVRGAPAIGVAAAYGAVLATAEGLAETPGDWRAAAGRKLDALARARPTAVNLHWAVARMRGVLERGGNDPVAVMLAEARAVHEEDIAANRRMGELGAALLENCEAVLTHGNTGSLATGGYGTALGVIRSAWAKERIRHVYAAETRPWLQGSRLTAWELMRDGIPVTLIADSAAAQLMRAGRVGWVILGADRIAANGDVVNKIGTYAHAVNARHHGVGFMVVAPTSTIDPDTAAGADITIEERDAQELLSVAGTPVAPPGVAAYNPVFDLTPAHMVDVLVTEKGVIRHPDRAKIARLLGG
jgi:methylthioribose-1-phosphate isomerase